MFKLRSIIMKTGARCTTGLMLFVLLSFAISVLKADERESSPEAIVASIGMLKTPDNYPPDFLRMAADKVAHAPTSWLPTILLNMEDGDYATTNWLKWAGDQIVQRNSRFLDEFPIESLDKVCDDPTISPSIRETSLGWLEALANQVRAHPQHFEAYSFVSPPILPASASKTDMQSYWSPSYGIRWQAPLRGRAVAAPLRIEQCVISLTSPNHSRNLTVCCHDEATGLLQWSHLLDVPDSERHDRTASQQPSCQVIQSRSDQLIVLHDRYGIAAFSTEGKLLWIRPLEPDLQKMPQESQTDLSLTLLATLDEVFLQIHGVEASCLICLDAEDGQLMWRKNESSKVHSIPMIVDHKAGQTLIAFATNRIEGLSPTDGEVRWSIPEPDLMCCAGRQAGTSRVHYESIQEEKRTLRIIDLESCGPLRSELECDLREARQLFAFNDHLLELTPKNLLVCLSQQSSEVLWSKPMDGDVLWPPLFSQGHLFVTNRQGKTLILGGTEFLHVRGTGDLGEPVQYEPVEGRNTLIFQTQTHLVCVQPPGAARPR